MRKHTTTTTTTMTKKNQLKQQRQQPFTSVQKQETMMQPLMVKSTGKMDMIGKFISFFRKPKQESKSKYLHLSIATFTNETWVEGLQRQGRMQDYYFEG
jgi:hypothetical protein